MNTYSLDPILQSAIADVIARLNTFAQDPLFSQNWKLIFGNNKITSQQFLSLVNQLPTIQIRTANELSGAKGAFAAQNNTIYLSESLFQPNQSTQLTATLLEEIGHYLDVKVNTQDTKGDEGELFSAVVRGIQLSESELTRIRNENDQAVITLDNKLLTVEQSQLQLELYLITGNYSLSVPGWERWYYSPQIVDNNIVWYGYDGQIHLQNITQLTDNNNNNNNNNNLQTLNNTVWSEYDGHDYEIYLSNEYSTLQLTNNDIGDYSPSVSGNNVVWVSSNGYGSKIYLWNRETICQVNAASDIYYDYYNDHYFESDIFVHENIAPQISGNYIVWQNDYISLKLGQPGTTTRYPLIWSSELWMAVIYHQSFTTTSQSDFLPAEPIDNFVYSTLANLKQNDTIDGGFGSDTLIISEGNKIDIININASNSTSQILDISGTKIVGFERFDFSQFLGNVNFIGSSNDDWIQASLGTNKLEGGGGNDTYIINSSRNTVIEKVGEGYDIVQSAVTYILPNNVEVLTLTGSNAINGTGNALNNQITGNSGNNLLKGLDGNDSLNGNAGNDTLVGGLGNDQLTGGAGSDQFLMGTGAVFNPNNFGIDTITDFASGADKIVLSKTSFPVLTSTIGNNLKTTEFAIINSSVNEIAIASSSLAKIVYNSATGNLFYNQNGAALGLGSGGLFALIDGHPSLISASDFLIQA